MPHIHTQPGEHDFTASAFIIRLDRLDEHGKPKLLLHRHKKLHKLLQFGGHVELNETPWQAVLHELAEETGYEPSQLKLLQPPGMITSLSDANLHPYPVCINTHTFDPLHNHTDIAYAFTTDQPPSAKAGEGESVDFKLVSEAELQLLTEEVIKTNVKEIGLFVFNTCLNDWEPQNLDEWR